MKFLTPHEQSKWIETADQVEDPHHAQLDDVAHLLHAQFYAPQHYKAIECFVLAYLNEVATEGDLLVQIFDWYPFDGATKVIFEAVRKDWGELRDPSQAPGNLFCRTEQDKLVALMTLTSAFGWTSYLYSAHDQLVLHNWEGEIFDVWTISRSKLTALDRLLETFQLEDVPHD